MLRISNETIKKEFGVRVSLSNRLPEERLPMCAVQMRRAPCVEGGV